jgi:hypothetical protein
MRSCWEGRGKGSGKASGKGQVGEEGVPGCLGSYSTSRRAYRVPRTTSGASEPRLRPRSDMQATLCARKSGFARGCYGREVSLSAGTSERGERTPDSTPPLPSTWPATPTARGGTPLTTASVNREGNAHLLKRVSVVLLELLPVESGWVCLDVELKRRKGGKGEGGRTACGRRTGKSLARTTASPVLRPFYPRAESEKAVKSRKGRGRAEGR